jgi:hypothetical protein
MSVIFHFGKMATPNLDGEVRSVSELPLGCQLKVTRGSQQRAKAGDSAPGGGRVVDNQEQITIGLPDPVFELLGRGGEEQFPRRCQELLRAPTLAQTPVEQQVKGFVRQQNGLASVL